MERDGFSSYIVGEGGRHDGAAVETIDFFLNRFIVHCAPPYYWRLLSYSDDRGDGLE